MGASSHEKLNFLLTNNDIHARLKIQCLYKLKSLLDEVVWEVNVGFE